MIDYLRSLSSLEVLNVTLAFLGALAAFASINLMKDVPSHVDVLQTVVLRHRQGATWWQAFGAGVRDTETMGIACALVTVAAGLAGQAMGQLAGAWQSGFDTLMYGGVLASLVSNRRSLAVIAEYKAIFSLGLTGVCWILFLWRAH